MIIMGKYKITNRGWIVGVCLLVLVVALGMSLFNDKEDVIKEESSENENAMALLTEDSNSNKETVEKNSEKDEDEISTEDQADEESSTSTTEADVVDVVIEEADFMKIKETVYFDGNKIDLKEEYHVSLDKIVAYVKENPGYNIVLEGNMNSYPNIEISEKGKQISKNRANVVAAYFSKKGIESEELLIIDNLDNKPLVKEGTYKDFQVNRRVDIYLIKKEN